MKILLKTLIKIILIKLLTIKNFFLIILNYNFEIKILENIDIYI